MRTSLALRQGIWHKGHPHWQICGVPDVLYTDTGSDFTSRHLQQVAADLKIRLVFSIPGKPPGRGTKRTVLPSAMSAAARLCATPSR
jgi:putative transposase